MKQKKRFKWIGRFLLISFIFVFLVFGKQVAAKENEFFVDLRYPENQIGGEKGYFDLRVMPGQKETLEVIIQNLTDREKTLSLHLTSATTSKNGGVNYGEVEVDYAKIHPFAFSTIAILPMDKLVLAPYEERMVPVELAIPEKSFDGVVLGGIYVSEFAEDNKDKEDNQFSIQTLLSIVRVVQLSENDIPLKPELRILGAEVNSTSGERNIEVTLENPVAMILNELQVNISLSSENDPAKTLMTKELKDVKVAPSSSFVCEVSIDENVSLRNGKYIVTVEAIYGEQTWLFEEKVEITDLPVNPIVSGGEKGLVTSQFMWELFVVIVLLFIVIAGSFWFLIFRKKSSGKKKKRNKMRR